MLEPPITQSNQISLEINSSRGMIESKETHANDMRIIMEADKQAKIFQRFISLAEKIKPQLWADGANLNLWSKNMITAWMTYFMGDPDYFQQMDINSNIKRNLVSRLFIEHSVSANIYESITSCILDSDAQEIYWALKDPFNHPSWSSVVYHATSMHQLITPAINTLMATNPNIKVCPDDLLNMIRQISTASLSFDHGTEIERIEVASKFGRKDNHHVAKQQIYNKINSRNTKIPPSSRHPD
ncbi:hypothetical protein O181_018109 [Austropuccinia psidii MF-1]|uniref:Uncharacterized protein n=1 Tax=Austropuccinia psidii MF-1 TaxID=1389203 RepID=A0A9Q3C4N5_9BASI|nr:hypothetical protein [Austropuccinia psidii MF-1]